MKLNQQTIFRMYQLQIQPQDCDKFVAEGTHNMLTSHQNESGTLTMFASHADDLGTDNFVFEMYQNSESYQIHANSPQFKRYGQLAQQVLIGRSIAELKLIYLQSPESGFTVSGVNSKKLLLIDFQVKSGMNDWNNKLEDMLVENSSKTISQYLATFADDVFHGLLLMAFDDDSILDGEESYWKKYLENFATDIYSRNLSVDTMVAQKNITSL